MLARQLLFRQLPYPISWVGKITIHDQYMHEEALALGYSYLEEREFAIGKAIADGLIDRYPVGDEYIYQP